MNVTLYTCIGDFGRIHETVKRQFSKITKAAGNTTPNENGEEFNITLQDDTNIKFYIVTKQGHIKQQMPGMCNYFAQVQCENQELHENVLRQIEVFNCIIGSNFDTDDDDDNRTDYIINTMFAVAEDINALVLMPNMSLFNSKGKLVLSVDGKSDLESYTPIANSDFLDKGAEEMPADLARKERSIKILMDKNIPYISHLRSAVTETEAKLRSQKEIAERLLSMFSVSVYCEGRGGGETWEQAQEYLKTGNDLLEGRLDSLLTPEEKTFLNIKEPNQRELAKFGWRYECCHVLMWALGLIEDLGTPGDLCDVSNMAKTLFNSKNLENLLKNTKLRSNDEILDAADLILRYNWACVDARIKGKNSPVGLNDGVVQEWHYAFNWLIGANENADWDNIQTNT